MGRTAPTMKTSRRPLGVEEDACMVAYESEEAARKGGQKDRTTRRAEIWAKTSSDATFNANHRKSAGGPRCQLQFLMRGEKGRARSPF